MMLTMEPRAVKPIGIAVVEQADHFLIGIRGPDQVLAGCAEFPGGKCEAGESHRECAVRECFEETGLAVIAERLLQQISFCYPHGDVELHFWLCRPSDVQDMHEDQRGFRWIPRSELRALQFPEANQPVIDRLMSSEVGVDRQQET